MIKSRAQLAGRKCRGYIRESTDKQAEKWRITTQRTAIEKYASDTALLPPDEYYTDLISGKSTLRRSGFAKMLEDSQNGEFEVLLVFHTSRFARNRHDSAIYKRALRRAGVTIVFVSQDLINGVEERMVEEGIYELFDEHQLETIKIFIRGGVKSRFEAGNWVGHPPYGLVDVGCRTSVGDFCSFDVDDPNVCSHRGKLIPDERTRWRTSDGEGYSAADVIKLIFERYVHQQTGTCALVRWLNEYGYRTNNGPWTRGAVADVLSNPAYVGTSHWALRRDKKDDDRVQALRPDTFPALISSELWEGARRIAAGRAFAPKQERQPTRRKRKYPLRGVAVCAYCGGPMVGESKGNGQRYMVCSPKRTRLNNCVQPTVSAESLEDQIGDVLARVDMPENWRALAQHFFRQQIEPQSPSQSPAVLVQKLARIRDAYVTGDFTKDEWLDQRAAIIEKLQQAEMGLEVPKRLDEATALLAIVGEVWKIADLEHREQIVQRLFDTVIVRGREIVSVKPRPDFVELFAIDAVTQLGVRSEEDMAKEGEDGSGGRIRTYDQAVNSRPLYH
jgi:DNA invertase Pin-like site-specific DNA recombinase